MSPREEFAAIEDNRLKHARLIALPELRRALEVSMLQYLRQQTQLAENSPGLVGDRLAGAQQFVNLFLSLADLPIKSQRKDQDNLPNQ